MKITLNNHSTQKLALERLRQLFAGTDITYIVDFDTPKPPNTETLTSANKIELIKFARKLVEDTLAGVIVPAIDRDGHKYFGLADAKHYVEEHFGWTP